MRLPAPTWGLPAGHPQRHGARRSAGARRRRAATGLWRGISRDTGKR